MTTPFELAREVWDDHSRWNDDRLHKEFVHHDNLVNGCPPCQLALYATDANVIRPNILRVKFRVTQVVRKRSDEHNSYDRDWVITGIAPVYSLQSSGARTTLHEEQIYLVPDACTHTNEKGKYCSQCGVPLKNIDSLTREVVQ